MIPKVLSWVSLAFALLFVALMLAVLFASAGKGLVLVAIGSLVLSMLLAVAVLILGSL